MCSPMPQALSCPLPISPILVSQRTLVPSVFGESLFDNAFLHDPLSILNPCTIFKWFLYTLYNIDLKEGLLYSGKCISYLIIIKIGQLFVRSSLTRASADCRRLFTIVKCRVWKEHVRLLFTFTCEMAKFGK